MFMHWNAKEMNYSENYIQQSINIWLVKVWDDWQGIQLSTLH